VSGKAALKFTYLYGKRGFSVNLRQLCEGWTALPESGAAGGDQSVKKANTESQIKSYITITNNLGVFALGTAIRNPQNSKIYNFALLYNDIQVFDSSIPRF
jgi:hypothetical protein